MTCSPLFIVISAGWNLKSCILTVSGAVEAAGVGDGVPFEVPHPVITATSANADIPIIISLLIFIAEPHYSFVA